MVQYNVGQYCYFILFFFSIVIFKDNRKVTYQIIFR